MMGGRDVYVTWDGGEVHLRGHSPAKTGLFVSDEGIDGWDSSPDAKVSMTEMQTGDGAHAIQEQDVLYSARTVTIGFTAHGSSRSETVGLVRSLSAACHHIVTLRVVDADDDTWATGYVQPGVDARWWREWATGTLTVVCADPRRYSTEAHRAQLLPSASTSGGLFYGSSGGGLVYDLTYGEGVTGQQVVATLSNAGTSTAYPTVTVYGDIDANLRLTHDGGALSYSQAVGHVPLLLDSLTRTASVGGADASRQLTSRQFPTVPPGGSTSVTAYMTGTGWATVEWHDTYV